MEPAIATQPTPPQVPDAVPGPAVPDVRADAERLTAAVLDARIRMRLMGGMAIWLTSPSVRRPPYARPYRDLDFAADSGDRKRIGPFFEAQGYIPERLFNKLHGAHRLNFAHPSGAWTVDVVFDELRMSHSIDLRGRLAVSGPTLDLADLLLTKLQIWEINEKDLRDAACLLADHAVLEARGSGDTSAIDLGRVLALTTSDWGLCHTVERNLGRLAAHPGGWPIPEAPYAAVEQARSILGRIEAAPKSIGWRARARVGERVRWYETPEEVRHEAGHGDVAPATGAEPPAPGSDAQADG